ncbi:STAS domain-containing protein [Homoserinibacter sp. GY 40078]|uniref:STAS domain-containing protein n=1 Tax=Homoserinibacter sp. GY 40078 TaxID=2603275 RepID=UPI0011C8859F|nr:STAS domain-containing protein [Homoserinibacter sp. GY 40078]TXK17255.1 STAS domain-containing protein [Homoserinibacter sp. GY 40078]
MTDDDRHAPTQGQLTFTVASTGPDSAALTLAGRFDAVEAVAVRERLAQPDLTDARHLVIDLRAVAFIDSAGLAALARARRDRTLTGGSVTLVRPASEDAMRVFRLTQFDEIFTMIDSPPAGTTS